MSKNWRGILLWTAGTLILAAGIHHAAILLYPRALISYVSGKIVGKVGKNAFHHGTRPTPKDRIVVLPSPDLIYSSAAFDLTKGPVRITAPLTGSYMSISLYASNSDNFFVMNDQQVKDGKFDIVLARPEDSVPDIPGAQIVRAPSASGIMLIRYFAGEGMRADEIAARQKQITCTVCEPGTRLSGSHEVISTTNLLNAVVVSGRAQSGQLFAEALSRAFDPPEQTHRAYSREPFGSGEACH
jgi:uncharacterized membrane protein